MGREEERMGGPSALPHLSNIPATGWKRPGRASLPIDTLQKEFAAFPWAEIRIFIAALSRVKKQKVSGERNPDAVGCKVTVSREQGEIWPRPVMNNK